VSSSLPGDLHVLFDDPTLRIACRRGGADTDPAVVAFAGIQGAFGGIPVEEFASSLGNIGSPHEAWFVIDKTRGWYNRTSTNIEALLGDRLAGRHVVTLGNSMGGFGALYFGDRFRAAAVLAICPQYAIDPALVPFETRWQDCVAALPAIRHPICLPEHPDSRTRRFVLTGTGHESDLAHARLIQARLCPGDAIFGLKACGHDVAQVMKRNGALPAILEAVMAPAVSGNALAACLDAAGLDYDLWTPAR